MELKNYINNNLTIKDFANFIDAWEIHRCADGEENVFDLENNKDYVLFKRMYDYKIASICRSVNRFWFAGNNYDIPKEFPKTTKGCIELAEALVEEKYILERPDIYYQWVDVDKLKEVKNMPKFYLTGNEERKSKCNELDYNVVLQWFSVIFFKAFENNIECFTIDASEDDIMDIAANLAYEFVSIHKFTAWETTFKDYVLHFIVNELIIQSTLFNERIIDYKTLINYFKNRPEYYHNF